MVTKPIPPSVFHISACAIYLAAIIKYEFLPPMPHKSPHEHFAGRLKYLTYWNLWIQFLYFGLALYIDFKKETSRNYSRLVGQRDKLFATLALPYGLFVFLVFWTLYAINREFIFPKLLDAVFPPWLNHVSHTIIVPVLIFEAWSCKHQHPRRKQGLTITLGFAAIYVIWVLFLGLGMDIWVYPILKILDWGKRIAFFAVCTLFLSGIYLISEKLSLYLSG